jgi:hypothetical protein
MINKGVSPFFKGTQSDLQGKTDQPHSTMKAGSVPTETSFVATQRGHNKNVKTNSYFVFDLFCNSSIGMLICLPIGLPSL